MKNKLIGGGKWVVLARAKKTTAEEWKFKTSATSNFFKLTQMVLEISNSRMLPSSADNDVVGFRHIVFHRTLKKFSRQFSLLPPLRTTARAYWHWPLTCLRFHTASDDTYNTNHETEFSIFNFSLSQSQGKSKMKIVSVIFLTAHKWVVPSSYKHFHEIFTCKLYTIRSMIIGIIICVDFSTISTISHSSHPHTKSQTLMREFFVCDLIFSPLATMNTQI